jgi:Na+-driven multidrug efflux pump
MGNGHSQFLSAAVCCLYLKRAFPQAVFQKSDMRFDGALLKKTLHFGAVSALHQSSLYIGKMLVQGAVNTMGTEMITAFTAATRIEGFANSIGDSGGEAISIFVAQNTGYGGKRRANRGFLTGLAMMALLGTMLSLVMHMTANAGIALMLGRTSGAASDNGIAYMRTISLFYTLCFTGNSFVGMYRGIGKVNIPVLGTVMHISLRVVLSYLLIGGMGLKAVAFATGTGWITVVLFQTLVYLGMQKKEKGTQDGHKGKAPSLRSQSWP